MNQPEFASKSINSKTKLLKRLGVVFTLLACTSIQCFDAAFADSNTALSAEQLKQLNNDSFEPLKTVASWPDSVKDFYKTAFSSKDLSKDFADPGKPFDAGCSRGPEAHPYRGFMLGAKSKTLCIINYQIGGIALRDMVDIFELKDKSANRIASKALYPGNASDLKQLLEQLRKDPILTKTK